MKKRNARTRQALYGPTQKDIADALGLSQSTVATALNPQQEHKLLPETVARIRDYATSVGYRPQRFAQLMRGSKARVIGVVVRAGGYLSQHQTIALLANALIRRGYHMVMVEPQWFGGGGEAVRDYLMDQCVDGVIFYNLVMPSEAEEIARLLPSQLPVVSMQSALEGVPTVRMDVAQAFDAMTRHHLALGARRLVMLLSLRDEGVLFRPAWTVRHRALGFANAIRAAGGAVLLDAKTGEVLDLPGCRDVAIGDRHEITGTLLYPEKPDVVRDPFAHGYYQMLRLIDSDEVPDSLLCSNDDAALGALAACSERGLRVPEDIRISGYDDTRAGAFSPVPITTIRNPLQILAEAAVDHMLDLVQGMTAAGEIPPSLHSGELVFRGSTATARELAALAENPFGRFAFETSMSWTIETARLCEPRADASRKIEV